MQLSLRLESLRSKKKRIHRWLTYGAICWNLDAQASGPSAAEQMESAGFTVTTRPFPARTRLWLGSCRDDHAPLPQSRSAFWIYEAAGPAKMCVLLYNSSELLSYWNGTHMILMVDTTLTWRHLLNPIITTAAMSLCDIVASTEIEFSYCKVKYYTNI